MTEEEFRLVHRADAASSRSGEPLNMILDDGGDLTAMVHDKFPELLTGSAGCQRRDDDGHSSL
jgi:adenosylhomocysteinase